MSGTTAVYTSPGYERREHEYIVDTGDINGRRHVSAAHARGTEAGDLLFTDERGELVLGIARGQWTVCRRLR